MSVCSCFVRVSVPLLFAACIASASAGTAAQRRTATVLAGKARFEFLTTSLVRMQYAPTGTFVDAPTAVVQKRDWPTVAVSTAHEKGWLIAHTDALTLRYRLQSGAFTANNLEVTWKDSGTKKPHAWHPGDVDDRNLGGLTYSLDNISKPNLPVDGKDLESPVNDIIPGIAVLLPQAKPGLLSRNGYAFIDDSRTPLWNETDSWIQPRVSGDGQDWYLFTYASDYHKVMREYAQLCGQIPMIPRYVLGAWITDLNFEYFPGTEEAKKASFKRYGEQHLKDEIARFRDNHIPLDGLVLDFAWHNYGWQGGFDWSPLIPHPQQLLDWLHARGVKVSLNDHPGYANTEESILSHSDSRASEALKALGRPLPPKPTFDLDLSRRWKFATDAHDRGVADRWFAANFDDRKWKQLDAGDSWATPDLPRYVGVVWYRKQVRLPKRLPSTLYLQLSQQAKDYELYIDGRQIEHSHVQWPRRLTYADVTPYVKAGQTIEIAVRLEPSEYGSGQLRNGAALRDVKPPGRIFFDLSNKQQADISMRLLHKPLLDQGVAFWWVDGGSGATTMPGLDPQLWTNRVFYDATQQATGKRGFILSRYGDWGSERYPGYFTGDTYSQWPVLAYEVAYTVRGGNVLIPYMSHDIGGFHGNTIDFDLYARWLEFGTFSPLLRMHSAHENPHDGNARMPWTYGERGTQLVRKYFTLRTQLIPYIYTYTWQAHTESLPILRPLYLHDPDAEESYRHPHEYYFGDEMLVAPVLDASGKRTVYLPPGQWIDFFSGHRHDGGTTFSARYAVDTIPVFVRDGAIVPEQSADMQWSDAKPLDRIIVNVYGTGDGRFDLYEDDGTSLAYRQHEYALTPMSYASAADGTHRLVIAAATGTFAGQVAQRSYDVRFHAIDKPQSVVVDGKATDQWHWDAEHATAHVAVSPRDIRHAVSISWRADSAP